MTAFQNVMPHHNITAMELCILDVELESHFQTIPFVELCDMFVQPLCRIAR